MGPSQNPSHCHQLPSTFERTVPAACTALAPISFLSDAFLYSSCLRIVASRLRLAISAAARLLLEVQSRTNRFPRTHAPLNFSSSLSSFVCMSSPLHPQSLAHLLFVTGGPAVPVEDGTLMMFTNFSSRNEFNTRIEGPALLPYTRLEGSFLMLRLRERHLFVGAFFFPFSSHF